jgi:Fe2+ or Zn2+ uptake regulation protein
MNKDIIYKNIRAIGGRVTKIRREILHVLSGADCLMTQADILAHLKKQKMHPNRSTIFRELLFLTQNNIVVKNTISSIDYYEIPQDHHHHLICLNCNSIKKIAIGSHLIKQEQQIVKQNKFKIIYHSLEFYGYCTNCMENLK